MDFGSCPYCSCRMSDCSESYESCSECPFLEYSDIELTYDGVKATRHSFKVQSNGLPGRFVLPRTSLPEIRMQDLGQDDPIWEQLANLDLEINAKILFVQTWVGREPQYGRAVRFSRPVAREDANAAIIARRWDRLRKGAHSKFETKHIPDQLEYSFKDAFDQEDQSINSGIESWLFSYDATSDQIVL